MKKLIALYKAFSGGEWFRASLESIKDHVDGIVVVWSNSSWTGSAQEEDCTVPLRDFMRANPQITIQPFQARQSPRQEDQYRVGLQVVADCFGTDSAVLIVDTDEIWEDDGLAILRAAIDGNPDVDAFHGGLLSYLKSPFYRVHPPEPPGTLVALQSPTVPWGKVRAVAPGCTHKTIPGAYFHHFTYVRRTEELIRQKFLNTDSQEGIPGNSVWLEEVWPYLPCGTDLHMSKGHEHCWGKIKILSPCQLPRGTYEEPWLQQIVAAEEEKWTLLVRVMRPGDSVIPTPASDDEAMYGRDLDIALGQLGGDVPGLKDRLKTTYLEALWLAYWASQIPEGGHILEIGCGHGGSTTCLALGSKQTVDILAVDPFLPYDETTHAGIVRGVTEGDETVFMTAAKDLQYWNRLSLCKTTSIEYWTFRNEPVVSWGDGRPGVAEPKDLAFIDGNHTEVIVAADIAGCWGALKPGGLLVLHDYTTRFPGVIAAVAAFPEIHHGRCAVGTSLFYARKPTTCQT